VWLIDKTLSHFWSLLLVGASGVLAIFSSIRDWAWNTGLYILSTPPKEILLTSIGAVFLFLCLGSALGIYIFRKIRSKKIPRDHIFTPYGDVLWKTWISNKQTETIPYCPNCKVRLVMKNSLNNEYEYICPTCQFDKILDVEEDSFCQSAAHNIAVAELDGYVKQVK
jgi:predicted RNA-binding Zn-ribbon protein involved in translation (DUF1610 family)